MRCSPHTLKRSSLGFRANLDSSVNIMLSQFQKQFNLRAGDTTLFVPFWTEQMKHYKLLVPVIQTIHEQPSMNSSSRYRQINGSWNHKFLRCRGRSSILPTTAKNRSSAEAVTLTRPTTNLRITIWFVWNWFHNYEMTEWWTPKKRAISLMDCPASMCPTACQRPDSSIRLLEAI